MTPSNLVSRIAILSLMAIGGTVGCERAKSATPLSPSIAGPIAGVTITPPEPVTPASNQRIKDSEQPVVLVFSNPQSNGVRPYTLTLEIAVDYEFRTVVYSQSGIAPSADGTNRVRLPNRLQPGRVYFWRTKALDGANSSDWAPPLAFELLQPIVIGVPEPLAPIGGVRATTTTPELRVRNGVSSGPLTRLEYHFQASTSAAFTGTVANAIVGEGGGETRYVTPVLPTGDNVVFWHVRITDQEGNVGAWSRTESFRTMLPAPTPAPLPSPSPGGAGGACVASSPLAIVECERAKFGHMSHSQLLALMRAVARSLNANNINGGPWGVLRKPSGANCDGYSCDIICAGNGSGQRQYDALRDAEILQIPTWSGPLPSIRVDVCEIQ
jgi:hypothetical protein